MNLLKGTAAGIASLALVAGLSTNAFAAHNHNAAHKGTHAVFGTLCTYTADQTASIAPAGTTCGSSTDVTFTLNKHTKLIDQSNDNNAAPVAGDSAEAFLVKHHGNLVARRLRYGTSPFRVAIARVHGSYVSSTGDCSAGTLTIQVGHKNTRDLTFDTGTDTRYRIRGNSASCADAQATYATGERLRVRATELSDGSWDARAIDVKPAKSSSGHHK
jgi:hypothetical protein